MLSAGTDNGDGTWTLSAVTETTVDPETGEETTTLVTSLEDVLSGLTITPAENSDDDFTLWIGGRDANGETVGESSMVNMVVTGVADTPNLEVGDVVGPEDTFIPLDVSAGLVDTDGSETLSINISGIPQGGGFNFPNIGSELQAELPGGEVVTFELDPASDDYTIEGFTPEEMASILQTLEIKPPFNHDEDFTLTFSVTATEADGDSATVTAMSTVNVMPRADEPELSLQGVDILEDGQIVQVHDNLEDEAIPLNILPESTDPSEVLSVTISGVPEGAVIMGGTTIGGQPVTIQLPVEDGMVTIPSQFMDNLSITPPLNSNDDFQLTVTATSMEPEAEFRLDDTNIGAFDGMDGATEVTISGFPEGSTLSAGTDNGDGTWTISANHPDELADILDNVTLTTPENTVDDFTLQVSGVDANSGELGPNTVGIEVEDVSVANLSGILDIQVTGVADPVDIEINDVTGDEDTAIPLDITANLTDTDGSETLSVKIEGVPEGAVLTAGGQTLSPLPDGSYVLSADDLADVAVTPPLHSDVDFNLSVTVTNTENDGDSVTSEPFDLAVTVNAVADTPDLGVSDAIGDEDTDVPLSISPAELVDTDGSETLSITISGVPDGASLSAGTDNGDGTWTFVDIYETSIDPETGDEVSALVSSIEDQLDGLKLTPPTDSNEDFNLTVTATATEAENQDQATNVQTIHVDMHGVADTPTLTAALGDPVENGQGEVLEPDGSITYDLDIASALTDTDAAQGRAESETLSVTLSGMPDGVVFSAGVKNDDGTWTLGPDDLAGLQMTVGGTVGDDFNVTVTATATEDDGDTATSLANIPVEVANDPDLHIHDAEGFEDNPLPLNLDAALTDVEGETLSITIADIPEGAILTTTGGQVLDVSGGSITLTPEQLPDLHIQAPPDSNIDFVLSVTATSTTEFGDIAEVTAPMPVQITGIADDPDLATTDVVGEAETAIPLTINTNLTDTDGSETLSVNISNVPDGAFLAVNGTQLTPDADGSYTLTPDQLVGLSVTPPAGSEEAFTLLVKATTTEHEEDGTVSDTATVGDVLNVILDEGADPPIVNLGDAQGYEDTAIALNIDAQLQDLEETLSITISDVPPGATLSAGNLNPDGSYTLTQEQLANLTITPAPDSNVDFDLTVAVTSIDGTDTATVTETLHVDVIGVADDPNLTTQDVTGQENAVIPLDVTSSLNDTDGSETLSITIANVPAGAVLSAGINNNDGTWTLTPDQLGGLTITPPLNSEEDFTLQVTATTVENDGDTATVSGIINVDIEGIADAPVLNIGDAQGLEDTAIPLNIDAQLADADEVLSVTISAIPPGSVLMSGTTEITITNGAATLTQEQLADLTITPPADSNLDMNLQVTATATQGGTTATTTDTLYVDVVGVADAPNLATEDATGDENEGIPLDISTNLTDTDGSESLSITIGNVPQGASLNHGTLNADGTYTLTPAQLFGLEVTPPNDFEGTFTLFVTSTSTENDGDQANTFDVLNVDVEGGADTPVLVIGNASGLEDNAIPLDIDASLTDPTETLSVTIAGVPEGATLSAGAYNQQTGEWVLTPQELNGLSITPPEDSNVDFNLTVTATSTNGNGDIAETSGNLHVAVQSVADDPTLTTQDTGGAGGEAIDLEIASALTDLDGSESLSLTISGVPQGASLSAGVYTGNGTWALEPGDLDGLTITTPDGYDTDFDLTVTATATDSEPVGEVPYTDTASVTATIHVDMEEGGQADPPVLVVEDAEGLEDNAIPLDISASLTDPSETLSMTISGVPQGASLSLGTNEGNGVWSFTEADLANIDNLTITPPLHSDVDFDLTVTAISQDGDETATTTATLNVDVGGRWIRRRRPDHSARYLERAGRPGRFGDAVDHHFRCPGRCHAFRRHQEQRRHLDPGTR